MNQMDYAALLRDFGQGNCVMIVPSVGAVPVQAKDSDAPLTVKDILINCFGESFRLVLSNYIRMEKQEIRAATGLKGIKKPELVSWTYQRTESVLHQPISETAVDLIITGEIRGGLMKRAKNDPAKLQEKIREYNIKLNESGDGERFFTATLAFRVRYVLDMRPCYQRCLGPLIYIYDETKSVCPTFRNRPISVNEYLLPVLRTDDYTKTGKAIIKRFFPEAFEDGKLRAGFAVNGEELARRMGLTITFVHFADRNCLGRAYFNAGNVWLLNYRGEKYQADVRANHILVDAMACRDPRTRNSTIVHECIHIYLDYSFFMLQMIARRATAPFTRRMASGAKQQFPQNSPLQWMELQAEKLPAYVIMEEESTKAYLENLFSELGDRHSTKALELALNTMSRHYCVSKSMAKYRMIELGYYEAEGIYNYVDGNPIPDHTCAGTWRRGITYTINPREATRLCASSGAFDLLLRNGRFRYVEGHFCWDSAEYLEKICYSSGRSVYRLRPEARKKIDECCIAFEVHGRHSYATYEPGCCARKAKEAHNDRYLGRYQLSAEPDSMEYDLENIQFSKDAERWGELRYDLPVDFREAINMIVDKRNISRESLALALNVDRKTLYSAIRANSPSLSHMVGIMVALQVPYYISIDVIEANGPKLRNTPLHHLYRQMLLCAGSLTVERCNDMLMRAGFPPLFAGETVKSPRSYSNGTNCVSA